MIRWLRGATLCRLGLHEWASDSIQNNVCPCCLKRIRPEAFAQHTVSLRDGTEVTVNAISDRHAATLVVYGLSDSTHAKVSPRTGQPMDPVRIHPSHIVGIRRAASRGGGDPLSA